MLDIGFHLSNDQSRAVDSDQTSEDEEDDADPNKKHHSSGKASQLRFIQQVRDFKNAVLENGIFFANTSAELIVLDT